MKALLRFTFKEPTQLFLLDVTSLLYDLELMHDFSVLLSFKEYSDFQFSRFFWYRSGRPLGLEHRLRAFRIVKESPLTLEVIVGAIGGLWILIQMFEKIGNWRLNRKKMRLEVKKLRYEANIKEMEEKSAHLELETALQRREASEMLFQLIKRLESNPMQMVDMDIEIFQEEDSRSKRK